MIKLIEQEREFDRELLLKSLSGRKMLAYIRAYGTGYDFCRFYKVTDEKGTGFMFMINSTLIICADDNLEATEEIDLFVSMNLPFRIEGSQKILNGIKIPEHYQKLNRTIFELVPDEKPLESIEEFVDLNPRLTDVYKILSEGFPNIADFSLWYTDTSPSWCKPYVYIQKFHNRICNIQYRRRCSCRTGGYHRIGKRSWICKGISQMARTVL